MNTIRRALRTTGRAADWIIWRTITFTAAYIATTIAIWTAYDVARHLTS